MLDRVHGKREHGSMEAGFAVQPGCGADIRTIGLWGRSSEFHNSASAPDCSRASPSTPRVTSQTC